MVFTPVDSFSKKSKRILCVTSNYPRWAGDSTTPFVHNLAVDLMDEGWQVDILAPHAPGAALFEEMDGICIRRFRYFWPEEQQTVCYNGGALINIRRNSLNKLKLPSLVLSETFAIKRLLATGHYDLLHSHWILPQGFTGEIAVKFKNIPHVITVHGGDVFALKGRMMSWFKKTALEGADAITVNSSVTEQAVKDITERTKRLDRIPMGVSVKKIDDEGMAFSANIQKMHRINNGPLLLFIGRIVEEKGVEDLIHSIHLLEKENLNCKVLIVGEGPDKNEMQKLAEELKVTDKVHFTGWVDPADIPAYLNAADIFIGPSRRAPDGWIEALGLTFLEAMAAGTPVIATRCGGIVDYLIDGETGLLVDERAPARIAEAVIRIVNEPSLKKKMCRKAAESAINSFSREVSARAFSSLFNSLSNSKA